MHEVGLATALVIGVIAVSGLARRVRFPAPILLVLAGVGVSYLPGVPAFRLEPDLVLVVLLPPLLYSAASKASLIDIKRERGPIVQLAVTLVLLTTIAVGFGLHAAVPSVTLAAAMALGAVVAPPDAVAAAAIGRRSGLTRRTLTILEGESLFNDATALVALHVALDAAGHRVGALEVGGQFLYTALAGLAVGAVIGVVLSLIRRHVHDTLSDSALSLIAPFAAFIPAEEINASGVLAVVVTALILAYRSPLDQDSRARLVEGATWDTLQFALEGTVFALIGLQLRDILQSLDTSAGELVGAAAVVLGLVLLVRPAWIFASSWVAAKVRRRDEPPWRHMAVVSWAGMRGVVSLAAALSLPLDTPRRDLLVFLTFIVIVGTLGLQGLTLPLVIRKLGIPPPDPRRDVLQQAHVVEQATAAAVDRLHELEASEGAPAAVVQRLERLGELRTFVTWERLGGSASGTPPTAAYRRLRREMILAERRVLVERRAAGELDEEVLRRIQRELDLEDALLDAGDDDRFDSAGMLGELIPASPTTCRHLAAAAELPGPPGDVCEECALLGWEWVHLRQCLTCGHAGCCDSSRGRHADAHFHHTHHPVMRSAEPGEAWRWCYVDRVVG
jgi:monovalent cation/hydrogen antiporter